MLQNNYMLQTKCEDKSKFFFAIHSRVFSTHRLPLISSERVLKHEESGHYVHGVKGVRGQQSVTYLPAGHGLGLKPYISVALASAFAAAASAGIVIRFNIVRSIGLFQFGQSQRYPHLQQLQWLFLNFEHLTQA